MEDFIEALIMFFLGPTVSSIMQTAPLRPLSGFGHPLLEVLWCTGDSKQVSVETNAP